MGAHRTTISATQAFYLRFRHWCLLRTQAAQQGYRSSEHHSLANSYSVPQLSKPQQRCLTASTQLSCLRQDVVQERGRTRGVIVRGGQQQRGTTARSHHTSAWHNTVRTVTASKSGFCLKPQRRLSVNTAAGSELADSMRQTLRTLTKPCVLVTSCSNEQDLATYSGVTLSSFDAVTLDPVPHISFNIRVPSRTYNIFEASKQICVHILSATPAGATIADTFTKPYVNSQEPFELLKGAGALLRNSSATPQIQFEEGVISWLICEKSTVQELDVGDHKICTFVVKEISYADNIELETSQALAYGQKAFRSLGTHIEPVMLSDDNTTASKGTANQSRFRSVQAPRPGSGSTTTTEPWTTRRSSTSFAQTSGFHTSCRRSISPTASKLARFKLAVWDSGIGSPHALPSLFVEENPQPVPDSAMKETVEDFLCHSQKRPAERLLRLRVAQKEIEDASADLEAWMADGTLTLEESERLEDLIGANERFIARILAHRAALDLKEMLDRGHVSDSRVQYLEKCIEKGQAALLHEVNDFVEGKERKGFSLTGHNRKGSGATGLKTREQFEADARLLSTELMRLRDYYRDDDDDF